MTTMALDPHATTASVSTFALVTGSTRSTSQGSGARVLSVPEDQLYFWTAAWQHDEAEAVQELADGAGVVFEDGAAAVRWLLSAED
jgi:hypothetical protein